jgi:hypothetical protein
MNTYRVERAGTKYHVIEELPDLGTFEVVGFATEVDARAWLGDFLRMTGHVEPDPTDRERRWPESDRFEREL